MQTAKLIPLRAIALIVASICSTPLFAEQELQRATGSSSVGRTGSATLAAPGGSTGSASTSCYICKKCGDNVGNDPNCKKACDACSITAVQPGGGID